MIRFKMYENYIQYVDGIEDGQRKNLELERVVDGWRYDLFSIHSPELYISYRRHDAKLYLPGYGTDKDYNRIYFDKDDKDVILKLFEVFKDMIQLEGVDRWIL